MNKIKKLSFILIAATMLCSCSDKKVMEGKMGKQVISKVITMDSGDFIDLSNKDVNANLYTREDFNRYCSGSYYTLSTSLSIDPTNSIMTIKTTESPIEEFKGKTVEASFVYEVSGLGENLINLRPLTRSYGDLLVDGKEVSFFDAPFFALYIPIMGFGENRIEVNKVLDGECLIPSGTYWKE